jgi:hypothetical protein
MATRKVQSTMPTQKRKGGKKVRGGSNGTSSVSTSSSSTKGTRTKSPKAKRATSKYNTVQSDEEDEEPSQTKARGGNQTRTATPRSESDSDDPKEQPSDESEDDDDEEGDDVSKDDDVSCHSGSKTAKRVYTYQVATTNNTQLNLQRTDSERPRSSRPTPPKPQPNTVWKDIDENMKQVKVEKTAVHDFVSNNLFPKLKFVRGSGVNMDYSTEPRSICSLVMAGCHQIHSSEGMVWWGVARKQTVNEIKRLRNDASKTLKRAFLGKNRNMQEDTSILNKTLT